MNVVAELIQQCIAENARIAQNQAEYEKRYHVLAERFDRAKARRGGGRDRGKAGAAAFHFYRISGIANGIKMRGESKQDLGIQMKFILFP